MVLLAVLGGIPAHKQCCHLWHFLHCTHLYARGWLHSLLVHADGGEGLSGVFVADKGLPGVYL